MVSAIGYAVGEISIRGAKLGSAAVLFVGLGFGSYVRIAQRNGPVSERRFL